MSALFALHPLSLASIMTSSLARYVHTNMTFMLNRSLFELPLQLRDSHGTNLRISLPPLFPEVRRAYNPAATSDCPYSVTLATGIDPSPLYLYGAWRLIADIGAVSKDECQYLSEMANINLLHRPGRDYQLRDLCGIQL